MGREARRRAMFRAAQPEPRLIFGLTKHQKRVSFSLSYAMAHIGALKADEATGIAGTSGCLYVKLDNLEDHLGRVLDHYRIAKFHTSDLKKAEVIFDAIDEKIQEIFPSCP